MTSHSDSADSRELLRDCVSVLVKAGKLQLSTVDTTGFPKKFEAREFKTPVRYIGHLADMDLSTASLAGVWPSVEEVVASMNYHFHEKRIFCTIF